MTWISWLHLSDWHQKVGDANRASVLRTLLEDIEKRATIDAGLASLDFVFFTGDLAFSGSAGEYAAAQAQLVEPLLTTLGLGADRLFVIPGNHDVDQSEVDAFSREFLALPQDTAAFRAKFADKTWQKRSLRAFENYSDWLAAHPCAGFGAWGGVKTVTVKVGDGTEKRVAVLGVNSAVLCARNKTQDGRVDD